MMMTVNLMTGYKLSTGVHKLSTGLECRVYGDYQSYPQSYPQVCISYPQSYPQAQKTPVHDWGLMHLQMCL